MSLPDIVERLRTENAMPPHYGAPAIQREAADEIEYLRSRNKALMDRLKEAAFRLDHGWPNATLEGLKDALQMYAAADDKEPTA